MSKTAEKLFAAAKMKMKTSEEVLKVVKSQKTDQQSKRKKEGKDEETDKDEVTKKAIKFSRQSKR